MDVLDRDRLVELYTDLDVATEPPSEHVTRELSAEQAYWQGRIDEYAAQNDVSDEELAECSAVAKAAA